MIRSELVLRIAESNPHLYLPEVVKVVDTIINEITAGLVRGDRIELRGFGMFSTRRRSGRTGRNPRTGAAVAVTEKTAPFFRPGKEIRQRLNPSPAARSKIGTEKISDENLVGQ